MGRSHHALKPPHHLYLPTHTHQPAPFQLLKFSYDSSSSLLYSTSISAYAVGDRIPGFKVSAAFLSNLHSNIFIELDSNYDSPEHTPFGLRPTIASLPPSPLPQAMSSMTDRDFAPPTALELPETAIEREDADVNKELTVGEDGISLLRSFPADNDDIRAEALHLIADSVAQQRNTGSRALIYHPISIAILAASIGILRQIYTEEGDTNWIMVLTTFVGVIMSLLAGIRLLLGPYILEAERVGTYNWLNHGRSAEDEEETGVHVLGDSDEVLVTKFGDEYIGAIVFRGVQPVTPPTSPGGNRRSRKAQSSSAKLLIRAWSVKQKYRRKEIGSALLEDAIKVGQQKGWTADGIEFAKDHANHKRILPSIFNGALDRFDDIAQNVLDKKIAELDHIQKGRKRK